MGKPMLEELTIERLSYGDEAVAHLSDGRVAFIEGACPGDRVRVDITEGKERFVRGHVTDIIEASPDRVDPRAPFEIECGTCGWQHVAYERQLIEKRDNIVAQLVKVAHVDAERAQSIVAPCIPSDRPWGYRNKLEFACATDASGFTMGYHRKGADGIASPKEFPLGSHALAKAPKAVRGALRFLAGNNDLGIYRVGIRGSMRTKSLEVALWTEGGNFPRVAVAGTLARALKASSIVRVATGGPQGARKVKGVEVLHGTGYWKERLCQQSFKITAPSFFQVNTEQAERLVETTLEALDVREGDEVADLYCGVGTFTIPLARTGAHVYGVESYSSSVRDLRRVAEETELDIDVIGGDAARELPMLGHLDTVLVDPPRAGLDASLVKSIAEAGPTKVAYVSCDPATWARDVARFEAQGYELERATPVDLFPQTYHVETTSILRRIRNNYT